MTRSVFKKEYGIFHRYSKHDSLFLAERMTSWAATTMYCMQGKRGWIINLFGAWQERTIHHVVLCLSIPDHSQISKRNFIDISHEEEKKSYLFFLLNTAVLFNFRRKLSRRILLFITSHPRKLSSYSQHASLKFLHNKSVINRQTHVDYYARI